MLSEKALEKENVAGVNRTEVDTGCQKFEPSMDVSETALRI